MLTVVLRHDIVLGTVPPHDFADVTVQDFMAASFLPLNVSVSQVDDQAIKPGSGRLRSWTGSGAFNPGHSYPIILEFYSRLSWAMSRLMLKSAKRASLIENLRSLRGLGKMRVR